MRKGSDHTCKGENCSVCKMLEVGAAAPSKHADEIERLALIDEKTELFNVRKFQSKLDYEFRRGLRYKRPVTVFMICVDDFENIQREQGDLTCDAVLKAIAKQVKNALRDIDVACIYESGRMAVVLPETNASGAMIVAERIRSGVEANPITYNWHNLRLTASIGIASFPAHAKEPDGLIARSLEALRVAAKLGGNRVHII